MLILIEWCIYNGDVKGSLKLSRRGVHGCTAPHHGRYFRIFYPVPGRRGAFCALLPDSPRLGRVIYVWILFVIIIGQWWVAVVTSTVTMGEIRLFCPMGVLGLLILSKYSILGLSAPTVQCMSRYKHPWVALTTTASLTITIKLGAIKYFCQ